MTFYAFALLGKYSRIFFSINKSSVEIKTKNDRIAKSWYTAACASMPLDCRTQN